METLALNNPAKGPRLRQEASGTTQLYKKKQLKGMTLEELHVFFKEINQPGYRSSQVFNWMYNYFVTDFEEMLNIPKPLRKELSQKTILNALEMVNSEISSDKETIKFIFKTLEGNFIESVIIPEEKRTTLCISTQAGCPLDCKFCATGLMGYKKNLTAGEIFDQYAEASRYWASEYPGKKITNIVYMGMGEPLLNFNSTLKTLQIFSEQLAAGITLKKITVSTAGIAPKITELANSGLRVKLAFSLHSCFEDIRTKIMPITKKYSLAQNIEALKYYAEKTKGRITFEYVMLKGINDREEDVKELTRLSKKIPSKINIIPFNSLEHMHPDKRSFTAHLRPTPTDQIHQFAQKLRERDITVMVRDTQGEDIAAACGQLAVKF